MAAYPARPAGLRMTGGGCRGVSPGALRRNLLAIAEERLIQAHGSHPLGISSLILRYRQKRLQTTRGTSVVVHSWRYYPIVRQVSLGGRETVGRPMSVRSLG